MRKVLTIHKHSLTHLPIITIEKLNICKKYQKLGIKIEELLYNLR